MEGIPFGNFELDRFEMTFTTDGIWHYTLEKKNVLIYIDQIKTRYNLSCYLQNEFHMSMTGNFNQMVDAVTKFMFDE